MKEKEYKAIWVTPELHYKLKVEALKLKMTMKEYLEYLMKKYANKKV